MIDDRSEIVVGEIKTQSGHFIGTLSLNAPNRMNSLTLEMVSSMLSALLSWETREDIACVVIDGRCDRAFCAGADIKKLYFSCMASSDEDPELASYASEFFTVEYRLDRLLHEYKIPTVCLGHGIVMGGGLGIFSACRHRLAMDGLRLAYPEITIGLFADAGASVLFQKMPLHVALFLALTGSELDSRDALALGVATNQFRSLDYASLLKRLSGLKYSADREHNHKLLDSFFQAEYKGKSAPPGPWVKVPEWKFDLEDASETFEQLLAIPDGDPWVDAAKDNLSSGCPVTAAITVEQIRRAKDLGVAECFQMELKIASRCIQLPDFPEGVRALLIDKDKQPTWTYSKVSDIPRDYLLSHF